MTRKFKNNSGVWVEETNWPYITYWQAEKVAPYLYKGRQVYVSGRVKTKRYKDAQEIERYGVDFVAEELLLLGARDQNRGEAAKEVPSSTYSGSVYGDTGASNSPPPPPPQATEEPPMWVTDTAAALREGRTGYEDHPPRKRAPKTVPIKKPTKRGR